MKDFERLLILMKIIKEGDNILFDTEYGSFKIIKLREN